MKKRPFKTQHVHLFVCVRCGRHSKRRRRAVAEALVCAVCERARVHENQMAML